MVVSFYVRQIWSRPAHFRADYSISDFIIDLDPDSRAPDLAAGLCPYGILLLPDAVQKHRQAPGGKHGLFKGVEPGKKLF